MDKSGSQHSHVITGVIVFAAVALSSLFTYLIVNAYAPPATLCDLPQLHHSSRSGAYVNLPENGRDYVEKLKDNGVTAMRAYGVNKCFILTGEQELETASNRVLTVLGTAMTHEQIDAVYGDAIADFCGKREGYAVKLDEKVRAKRQAANATAVDQTRTVENVGAQGSRASNQCQNQNVVICDGDDVVYKCNTGVGEVYHAQITCQKNNSFTFSLTKRCDKFKNTDGLRWIKCLSYFAQGPEKTGPQVKNDK